MKTYVFVKLELYTRGRDVFDQSQNSYPLHKAVFDQNLPLISRFVKGQYEGSFYQDKNGIDPCGNTPLILAVKLGHIDTIKVLCDLTCCPKLKSLQNCKIKNWQIINNSSMCSRCGKLYQGQGDNQNTFGG